MIKLTRYDSVTSDPQEEKVLCPVARLSIMIFLPVFMLALAVATAIVLINDRADLKIYRDTEKNIVGVLALNIAQDIHMASSDLAILADSPHLPELWDYTDSLDANALDELTQGFYSFVKHRGLYNQVRLLDKKGKELIRINFNNGQPAIVPPKALQNKSGRYYFEDTLSLNPGEVFVSPIDLNVEHGEIEHPPKPMIRFATPVADIRGEKCGIVLLNYFGAIRLDKFSNRTLLGRGNQLSLLNREGYWLRGQTPADEWGFMYKDRKKHTFASAYPNEWEKIHTKEFCQFETPRGLFTSRTVYPLLEGQISSTGSGEVFAPSTAVLDAKTYYWKIVSMVPADVLYATRNHRYRVAIWVLSVFSLIWSLASWFTARAIHLRKSTTTALHKSEENQHILLDNIQTQVWYLFNASTYGAVNKARADYIGTNKEAIAFKSIYDILPGDSAEINVQSNAEVFSTGESVCTREWEPNASGELRLLSITKSPGIRKDGSVEYVVCSAEDITESTLRKNVEAAKLRLVNSVSTRSSTQLLQAFLDDAETLTNSAIGFFHFVAEDQKTIMLQAWSTNTLRNACKATEGASHYSVDKAGVWVDCLRERKPVIHNDYKGLKHKKGLPAWHAPLFREFVVPVIRRNKVVAILGVGNKEDDYDKLDIEVVQQLADLCWETIGFKHAEEELQKNEAKLQAILSAMPDAAYIVSPDFRIEFMNPQMIEITGSDATGEVCHTVMRRFKEKCSDCMFERVQQGETITTEWTEPGGKNTYSIIETPVSNQVGTVSKLTVFRDITELVEHRKTLEHRVMERTRELSMTNAELARANTLKDEFLANMSHEFRTPLTAVLGMSEALIEKVYGPLNEQQEKSLQSIESSGQHLLDLINDILDLSKINAGKMKVEPGPVSISSVCQTSLQMIKQAALKKNQAVSLDIDCETDLITADMMRLKQILVNLLNNAVKYTPAGGKVGLEVSCGQDRDRIEFTIWDTGTGILPEDMGRLFKPFVQLDGSLTRNHEGTGLGLSLVQKLTELHNGSVKIESEKGKFTRVTVALPLDKLNEVKKESQAGKTETSDTYYFVDDGK